MTQPLSATLPFLRYELRRHLMTLVSGVLLLAVLPLSQRVITGHLRFWDGAWNVWGAVLALYVVMPLLVAAMAASGWPRERSLHTLEWLYARPLSSGAVFAARAIAIVVPALLWSGVAVAIHGAGATELQQALSTVPGLPGPAMLYAAQLSLALGAGLFVSALARSPETAFRGSLLLIGAAWVTALIVIRASGPGAVLVAAARARDSGFLAGATATFGFGVAAALAAGAWLAVSRDLDGRRRSRRAAVTASLAAGVALAVFASLLHVPYLALAESPFATSLGQGRGLTFRAAPGLPGLAHPVFTSTGRSTALRRSFVYSPRPSWSYGAIPSAERGAAIVAAYGQGDWLWSPQSRSSRWLLVEADGRSSSIVLPAGGEGAPMGWSPSGARFAWKWTPWWSEGRDGVPSAGHEPARLTILEPGSTLREVGVPSSIPAGWRVAWIDDQTLLLADAATRFDEEGEDRWAILDLDREPAAATEPRDVPPGLALDAPALRGWALGSAILPRLDDRPVVLLVDAAAADPTRGDDGRAAVPSRVARLDAIAGTLEPGPVIAPEASALSMGNLRDGALVWASGERRLAPTRWDIGHNASLYRLDSFDAEPRLLCTLPHGRIARFRGQSGAWAIWESIWFPEYQLWGCNVETGAAREIAEWKPWAHALATIGDEGLWTPDGWRAIDAGGGGRAQ